MSQQEFINSAALGAAYCEHVETLVDRHDRALSMAGASHAVLFSGAPKLHFLDDHYYPFTANPHFVSWLPLTQTPHCYLVHTPGEKPKLIYYQEKDYWHMPPAKPEGYWTSHFDISIVHTLDDVDKQLPKDRDKCILIGEIDDTSQARGIDRVNPSSAMRILHFARATKTAYEVECMRAASRRGVAGHRAAETAFHRGGTEFEIHLAYCNAVGQNERDLPYGNIIALNEHAAVLHYQHQSTALPAKRRSFLIDAGASVNGYASDITRTHAYERDEFADMVARFDEIQQAIVADVAVGVDYAALHIGAHARIAAVLIEFELVTGSIEALIANGVSAAFYPHGLGHFLGIQVHDVGGFMADESGAEIDRPPQHPFLRLTRVLEEDQVLTIEPGLYIIDQLLDNLRGTPGHAMLNQSRIDWLRPYGGIRIEDDVRVLAKGCENLTRDAFAAAAG